MDVQSFALNLSKYLLTAPFLPGNAQPTVVAPNAVDPSNNQLVGQDPNESSWSVWLQRAQNIATIPVRLGESAWTVFSNMASRTGSMVKSAVTVAESGFTGLFGILKWVTVLGVAIAIIYGLVLIAPFVKTAGAALPGGKRA